MRVCSIRDRTGAAQKAPLADGVDSGRKNPIKSNFYLGGGGLDGTRTHDPRIKSSVLYHLSYQPFTNRPFVRFGQNNAEFRKPKMQTRSAISVSGSTAEAWVGVFSGCLLQP